MILQDVRTGPALHQPYPAALERMLRLIVQLRLQPGGLHDLQQLAEEMQFRNLQALTGVRGGQVLGKTDRGYVLEQAYTLDDYATTVYESLGIGLAQPVYTRENLPLFLAPEGRPIGRLFETASGWGAAPARRPNQRADDLWSASDDLWYGPRNPLS
ncbi:MAG: hypothetical protein ACKV0T_22210 [Planctomycetales bacterium]